MMCRGFIFLSTLLAIAGTVHAHAIRNQKNNNPVISIPLHPQTHNQTARIISDIARVNYLNSRLKKEAADSNNLQATVSPLGGSYVAQILVGQPGREFKLLVDTGSELIWVKCSPCNQCSEPIFYPAKSSSFNTFNCTSPQCNWLNLNQLRCPELDGICGFKTSYVDGTIASGDYVTETLSFGNSGPLNNIAIGCTHEYLETTSHELDGVLGLGPDSTSINSQLNLTSFSYCQTPDSLSKSSTLDFNSVAPNDSVSVHMIRDMSNDIYYYVELTGITVGEVNVPVPPEIYQMEIGGVVIDSGTTLTYLDERVYKVFLEAFRNHTQHLQLVPSPTSSPFIMDACYIMKDLSEFKGVAISFQLSNDQSLALDPYNYMVNTGNDKYCLGVQPTVGILSVIGNVAQNGMRVTYDLEKSLISFSPMKC